MVDAAVERWTAALDHLDRQLDEAWTAVGRASLEELGALFDQLEVPVDMPTLPATAGARARAVLQRFVDLEALLARAQREVRDELEVTEKLAAREPAVPKYIDRRA